MQTFTMTKTGKLTLDGSSPNQCKKQGHKKFNWEVECVCGSKLDRQSFLIDNSEIDKAVSKAVASVSCEVLCLFITNHISSLLNSHGCQVKSIKVSIIPIVKKITTKMELLTTY